MTRDRLAGTLAVVVALVLVGAAGSIVLRRTWLDPAAALRADIATMRSSLNDERRALRDADDVAAALDEFGARSLGTSREAVDHALRTSVAGLAEAAGIRGTIVSTGSHRTLGTPMRSVFPRRGAYARLRDEPDLMELSASISGEATLPRVLDLLARLSAAPWPHRVDGFRLDPRRGGERLGFRVDLTTGYLPDRDGAGIDLAGVYDGRPSEAARASVSLLAAADRFRLPAPEPPPAPAPPPVRVAEQPPDPGPPPFPWGRWQLTGVADGPTGREAWLRRGDNGAAAVLVPGDAFESLVLESIDEDGMVLVAGDARIRITVGESLAAARRLE